MFTRIFFGVVVLLSAGVIYAVNYQKNQERANMRQGVIRELKRQRELDRLKKEI